MPGLDLGDNERLSIPLWFDWGWTRERPSSSTSRLSIPLWFDWGLLVLAPPYAALLPFNPTLVRLGRELAWWLGPATRLSIPLWFDWGLLLVLLLAPPYAAFNPTLVRLGPDGCLEIAFPARLFQSHFGSIGAELTAAGRPGGDDFQSHFGSIGASSGRGTRSPSISLSIPLWFDWGCPRRRAHHHGLLRFQSHFGSIGARHLTPVSRYRLPLSIPLWFDWGLMSPWEASPSRTSSGWRRSTPSDTLSIPLWFDWGATGAAAPARLAVFQSHFGSIGAREPPGGWLRPPGLSIPLWFDWGRGPGSQRICPFRLSIPLWFDWGTRPSCGGRLVPISFQSHFGSIGAGGLVEQPFPHLLPFNPTLVRLGLAPATRQALQEARLSIPLWFDWGLLDGRGGSPPLHPFNPTLVRLGRRPSRRLHRPHDAFNPTLVRLGLVSGKAILLKVFPFNPTLVRLGPEW